MPPHSMSRFQNGPSNMAYQHFPGQQPSNYPTQLGGNPSHLNPNAQIPSFTNGNMLSGLGGGMNSGAASFSMGHETGLNSQAVRQGFDRAMPQQPHSQQGGNSMMGDHPRTQGKGRIREVWAHNLEEEMAVLRELVKDYPYVAMDTEFPGVVARPMGAFRGKSDYHYQCMRANVDLLKVIQIGLVLLNEDGETPGTRANTAEADGDGQGRRTVGGQKQLPHAWQFNFQFDLDEEMYNQPSIESLQVAGIDFNHLKRDGIDPHTFAALLIPSGLVMFDEVKWLSFHGGYDFGYLTKLLHCKSLPRDEYDFDHYMRLYFPTIYDIKHLMKHAIKLQNSGTLTPGDASTMELLQKFEQKSGLENIAEAMKIKRLGPAHQAGSDALLTGKVFFQMRDKVFRGKIGDEHIGKIWGLAVPEVPIPTTTYVNNASSAAANAVDNTPPQSTNSGGQNGGAPSTPNTASASVRQTPAAQSHNTNGSMGPMTPGGPMGNFGMN